MDKCRKIMQQYCDTENAYRKTIGHSPLINLRFTDPEYALICVIMGSFPQNESWVISHYHENKMAYGLHKHGKLIRIP